MWPALIPLLLAVGTTGTVRAPRDTYLDAYADSHGMITERDSPPTGVVEAPAGGDPHTNPDSQSSYNPSPSISSSYSQPASNYGTPAPVYVTPSTSYGNPSASYGAPSASYGNPSTSYSTPLTSYGPPASSYAPPATSYGVPSPSYGVPASYYNHNALPSSYGVPPPAYGVPAPAYGVPVPTAMPQPQQGGYDAPNRGMQASIPIHTVLKILLKVLIFKVIVKFIAVICVLLFLPKFHDHGHMDKEEGDERGARALYDGNEKLDDLTKLVLSGITREYNMDECRGDALCRLFQLATRIDQRNSFRRLMGVLIREYLYAEEKVVQPSPFLLA